jgi:uncharacterized protein
MKRPAVVAIVLALVTPAGVAIAGDASYLAEVEAFRAKREAGLRADGSWLSVVGLHWLKEGDTTFGSAPGSAIRLPEAVAPRAGHLKLEKGRVTAILGSGVSATVNGTPVAATDLVSDKQGPPTILAFDHVTLQIIDRGGRLGVRVKDNKSKTRSTFRGLHWFPVDEHYRIEARFVPLSPHGSIPIANITGMVNDMESPGFAEFEWQGRTHRIQAVLEDPDADQLFFIFKDTTAGKKTYGAGRFLYAPLPQDGTVFLDFNKAYSPPCAFTAFATCPLPPRQNRLPFPVEAGEVDPH